jgi:catechol 2,3-dioxygenase-like lactoylglutathione lyase family enzyme
LGVLASRSIEAQTEKSIGLRVNHVGLSVKDLKESVDYYTRTLGMRQAFIMGNRNGNPGTYYIQVDKDTFLELSQATPDRPVGINHVGFETQNMKDTAEALQSHGVTVPEVSSVGSGAPHTSIMDPNGIRLEMLEFAEGSLQRKAINSYK